MTQKFGVREHLQAGSVNRALGIVGDRWTLLVLGQAFLGFRRFDDFLIETGIARSVLASRLRRMVADGLMRRLEIGGGKSEYRLTRKALDLYAFGLMGWRWEERWLMHRHGHPIYLVHKSCGCVSMPEFRCGSCNEPVKPSDVLFEATSSARATRKGWVSTYRRSRIGNGRSKLIGASIDVIGDRWTFLVIAAIFLGLNRYDQIQAEIRIATNILAQRLKYLTEEGLLRRSAYFDRRQRYEYHLTRKGLELFPMMIALARWGDRWLAGDKPPPHLHFHKPCGKALNARFCCSECNNELQPWDVTFVRSEGRRLKPGERAQDLTCKSELSPVA
jgi:DNA-binding HxlR family transcriptional regulator